jgi:tripartite-type tricarboxylate transporter receptor subunit TctC
VRKVLFLAFLAFCASMPAGAQDWPQKPVRLVVGFAPGGSADIVARILAERIGPNLGQPVVVENRVGASGNVAAEYVARQHQNDHVFLVIGDVIASTPHLFKLNFDPAKDLAPVVQLTRQPVVLATNPELGVSTVAELVALAKKKPGIAYGTTGSGSIQHIAGEWFAKLASIELTHVPYKGGGQAVNDLFSGQLPIASLGNSPLMPHYRAGKIRILAQTTKVRSDSLRNVPTYEEAGIRGLVLEQWIGVFAPATAPRAAVARLNTELGRALADPAVRSRLGEAGLDVVGGSSDEFARQFQGDFANFARLIKELNIRIE